VSWDLAPDLNITPGFLGRAGLRFSPEGDTATVIPTMTGVVISPEPYVMFTLTASLIKSQPLAELYKRRMEFNSSLGKGVVRPDVQANQQGVTPFDLYNCVIQAVNELDFSGASDAFIVRFRGSWYINSQLWDGA
jgi:hypothetical protein